MEIRQLKVITQEVVLAFQKLMPQLAENITSPAFEELAGIINSGNTLLFVAEENGEIFGTLTLVRYRIPSGIKGWIEDVVVDKSMRGKGIGSMLTQYAIGYAKENGMTKIDLTSSPFRIAANELYKKLGFKKRETNVYRLELE
jgi:ribosomal protein S18 acetylase RimI-like enzyme